MHALGIDVGSTNLKVVLVEDSGYLRASVSRPLHTHQVAATDTNEAAATQDAEHIWSAVCSAISEITAAEPSRSRSIGSIGVCSQYSSILGVGAQGNATTPLILYLDHRGDDLSFSIMERHEQAFEIFVERHGIPPIGGGLSLAHLLFIQKALPEIHELTSTYLEVMDFITLRLTGRATATQCTMFASQLCDNRVVGTVEYDSDLVAMAGVDASKLPALISVDGIVGQVSAGIATQLGLPTAVTVQAGMNDTQAAAFATGVLRNSLADPRGDLSGARPCGLMIGTTAVLVDSLDSHRVDLEHEVLAMPAPVHGRHIVMAENGISGRAVEHALRLLNPQSAQTQVGVHHSSSPFDELESALAGSLPGSGGMLFLPWLAGSMSPRAESDQRGGFIGLSLTTTREQMIRSVIEGTAHNLRWLLPAVEGLTTASCTEIIFGGGAARSSGWAQVLADVLNRPVSVLHRPELAAATAVAMVALFRTAGKDPIELELQHEFTYEPASGSHELYERAQVQFQAAFTNYLSICETLSHE
ncbi:MAG: FGGY family carbohydrate kinase [Microthrixaceae bacterium]